MSLKRHLEERISKACFAHDSAHANSNHIAKRTFPDKVLKDRSDEIALSRQHDEYQGGFLSISV